MQMMSCAAQCCWQFYDYKKNLFSGCIKNASTRQTNRQGKGECGRERGRQRTSDWYTPFTLAPKTPVSILLSVPKHISCGFYQCAAHPIDTDTLLQLQQNDDEFGFPLVQYEAKLKLIFEKREKRKRIIAAKTRQHMAEPSNPSHMVRSTSATAGKEFLESHSRESDTQSASASSFISQPARICHDLVYSVLDLINRFLRMREREREGERDCVRAGAARFFMASVVRASNYRADMELVKTIHEAGPGPES